MKIGESLGKLHGMHIPQPPSAGRNSTGEITSSFGDMLGSAISEVNTLQSEAGQAVQGLISGEAGNLHDVMISMEKAKTSFDLLMEIRNKAIDMYREMMRMPV